MLDSLEDQVNQELMDYPDWEEKTAVLD